jgi:hypothetical protein
MTESRFAFLRLETSGWERRVWNRAPSDQRELEQRWRLTVSAPNAQHPVLHFEGSLDRPAFAEITEVTPLPPTGATTNLHAETRTLRIDAPNLPARAEIHVEGSSCSWEIANGAAHLVIDGRERATSVQVLITCSLRETAA